MGYKTGKKVKTSATDVAIASAPNRPVPVSGPGRIFTNYYISTKQLQLWQDHQEGANKPDTQKRSQQKSAHISSAEAESDSNGWTV